MEGSAEASAMLPEQHEDQLQLGFRMIQNAFNAKVHGLEQELRGLRISHEEQKNQSSALQRKNSALEVELVEGHQRCQQLAEENKELFKTVQNLRRQIARLEGLKKKVMDSISEEQGMAVEGGSELYMNDEYLKGSMPLTMAAFNNEGNPQQRLPVAGQPQAASPADPASYRSPWSAPAAPPAAAQQPAPPVSSEAPIDGKQFFRLARNNLSYEAFNEFLANIKRLNNQQQTREDTLEEARRIFGTELHHLYKEFETLLNKHAV